LWEGACVVAGHQLMVEHGQPDFVDRQGKPWVIFDGFDAHRIRAFRAIGEAEIQDQTERPRRSRR
jgi:hypothetical protein